MGRNYRHFHAICMVPGVAYDGCLAWSVGYTGLGVGATRFGARIGIEMLGYQPSDILGLNFVTQKALPWRRSHSVGWV